MRKTYTARWQYILWIIAVLCCWIKHLKWVCAVITICKSVVWGASMEINELKLSKFIHIQT